MLKRYVNHTATRDVANLLYELGIVDSPLEPLDPATPLREGLDLDSQEMVSLVELASSLSVSCAPLDEDAVETIHDLVLHLATHRDPWLPEHVPFVMQGSIVIRQNVDTVFAYIADYPKRADRLPSVTRIEPEFDGGRMQIFSMHIEEPDSGAGSSVRSCRYVNEPLGIVDFAQLSPPAGFRVHEGGWRFKTLGNGSTELITYRGFDLDDMDRAESAITLVRQEIQSALNAWAHHGKARIHA